VQNSRFPWLRWLVWAAVADWLLARTLARSAIFMPKSPPVLAVYQDLIWLGQAAGVLASLLALLGMLWLSRRAYIRRQNAFALGLAGLAGLSLFFLVAPPASWQRLLYQALLFASLAALGWQAWAAAGTKSRLAIAIPWLALLASGLFQLIQALTLAVHGSATPAWSLAFFNLGELLAVITPIAFWWAFGRKTARWPAYLWALLPAAGFTGMYLATPSMAGILAIWSTGLSLYLPWPLYALALWLGSVACLSRHPAGSALLLLAAGGFTPGLTSQAFFGLLALGMLITEETGAAIFPLFRSWERGSAGALPAQG
jgi:hypothetical protein